ncbi:hypothetical protein BJX76DRAFT_357481 [Aspergillus varians]
MATESPALNTTTEQPAQAPEQRQEQEPEQKREEPRLAIRDHRRPRPCSPSRPRRGRSPSSPSASIVYRRYRISPSPPRLPYVSSHTELFPSPPHPDRYVLLTPYNREAYITTHPASQFDFAHWLPLLALGAPETWYAFSSIPAIIPHGFPSAAERPATTLKPLPDPRPVGLRIPRIAATAALHPDPEAKSEPERLHDEQGSGETNPTPTPPLAKQAPENLLYISIQQTLTGHASSGPRGSRWYSPDRTEGLPDLAGGSVTGQNIYRVVRCGSREEAAAQAFYLAGGSRWSTVFTCVVLGGVGNGGMRCDVLEYERVDSVGGLVGDGGAGKVKVFY